MAHVERKPLIVYVQQNLSGEWANINCFASAYGFKQRGYEVRPFTSNDLNDGVLSLSEETIVHGGVTEVRNAIRQIGKRPPDLIDYPHVLRRKFIDVPPAQSTIQKIEQEVSSPNFEPCFIKPSRTPKLFTGFVVHEFKDLLRLNGIPRDENVWKMRPIEWLSEYRIFMHHGKVLGMKHYRGDPLLFPDSDVLHSLVKKAKNMVQVAFSLDVGVAHFPLRPEKIRNPTLLVEANDAYALGAYGLSPLLYVQMIEDRWHQMMQISR